MARQPALDLLQGTLDALVLKILALGPQHGWGIAQRIEQISMRDQPRVQAGLALSCPRQAGGERLDRGRMGPFGQQPAGKVLQPHGGGDGGSSSAETKEWTRFSAAIQASSESRLTKGDTAMRFWSRLKGGLRTLFLRTPAVRRPSWSTRFAAIVESAIERYRQAAALPEERHGGPPAWSSAASTCTAKEGVRDAWVLARLVELLSDSRLALRGFCRRPAYAATVVVTVALAVRARGPPEASSMPCGTVVLRPLPFAADHRLAVLRYAQRASSERIGLSPPEMADFRSATHSFEGLAEYHGMSFTLLGHGEPRRVRVGVVSPTYFGLLGVKPILGRDFVPDDDSPTARPVLLLTSLPLLARGAGEPRPGRRQFHHERQDSHRDRRVAAAAFGARRQRRVHARLGVPVALRRDVEAFADVPRAPGDRSSAQRQRLQDCDGRPRAGHAAACPQLSRGLSRATRAPSRAGASPRGIDLPGASNSLAALRSRRDHAPPGGGELAESHPGSAQGPGGRIPRCAPRSAPARRADRASALSAEGAC